MRAIIYTRISSDPTGTSLGVARQEQDCRALCETKGWDVVDVIIENDTSAYGKAPRRMYGAMLDRIDAGECDALVVWHPDRLHRSPAELESFIDLVERTGLVVATCTAGDYDLATPEGRLTARIVGSVARKEVEDKSRRLRRKHLELAAAGAVPGGGRRPFGYETDRVTIREDEAVLIRDAAARVLAGESVRGIATRWNRAGVPTVTGVPWQSVTIKRMLTSARISGQREHLGQLGPAVWPAIIDPDMLLRLRVVLNDPARGKFRSVRSYLLSGFVWCGRCDVRMTSAPILRKGIRYPRYACLADRGGCSRCGIIGGRLDALVTEAVFGALDEPRIRHLAAVRDDDSSGVGRVAELEARLVELAEIFAAGEISRAEWGAARAGIDKRLVEARAVVAAESRMVAGSRWFGRGDEARGRWSEMSLDERRAVVGSVVERVVVAPTVRANNRFDPGRVTIEWTD